MGNNLTGTIDDTIDTLFFIRTKTAPGMKKFSRTFALLKESK